MLRRALSPRRAGLHGAQELARLSWSCRSNDLELNPSYQTHQSLGTTHSARLTLDSLSHASRAASHSAYALPHNDTA